MKKMSINTAIMLMLCIPALVVNLSAQEKFDVVNYTAPKGWQKELKPNALQFSIADKTDDSFALMMLFKALPAGEDARKNFDVSWESIVQDSFDRSLKPEMSPDDIENGWTISSGIATTEYNGYKAAVLLMSSTGGGKVINLLVVMNSNKFQPTIEAFIRSLVLPKIAVQTRNAAPVSTSGNSSLVGLWVNYNTETSGYMNGMPMLSGGYFRREYLFKPDGTYVFRAKDWSTIVKDILYVKETGTYSVNGNQITIKPTQTSGGWWAKAASGRTVGWGKKVRGSTHKSEPVTYTFEIKYLSGMGENYLILRSRYATERDGRQNSGGSGTHEYNYSHRATGESLIDDPQ